MQRKWYDEASAAARGQHQFIHCRQASKSSFATHAELPRPVLEHQLVPVPLALDLPRSPYSSHGAAGQCIRDCLGHSHVVASGEDAVHARLRERGRDLDIAKRRCQFQAKLLDEWPILPSYGRMGDEGNGLVAAILEFDACFVVGSKGDKPDRAAIDLDRATFTDSRLDLGGQRVNPVREDGGRSAELDRVARELQRRLEICGHADREHSCWTTVAHFVTMTEQTVEACPVRLVDD